MTSYYSPFFASGFLNLSQTDLASNSDLSSEDIIGLRRGSLPSDDLSRGTTSTSADTDEASAYYFTLQPPRSHGEFRSYLSLDLAESSSLRSVSTARLTADTISTSEKKSSKALRFRASRESLRLRTVPSPKPAPMATLPSLPTSPTSTFVTTESFLPLLTPPSIPHTSSRKRTISLETTPAPSTRATRHADALAKLEGRARATFMCFDEDEEHVELEDAVLPQSPIEYYARASFLCLSPISSKAPSLSSSVRRGPFDSLMSSFIDLGHEREDKNDQQWNWRSFIEVGFL